VFYWQKKSRHLIGKMTNEQMTSLAHIFSKSKVWIGKVVYINDFNIVSSNLFPNISSRFEHLSNTVSAQLSDPGHVDSYLITDWVPQEISL
jgi:hypothetical protein